MPRPSSREESLTNDKDALIAPGVALTKMYLAPLIWGTERW
jgi:hypothetical protein